MPEAQHAMLNDAELKDFGLLLLQEPSCFWTSDQQAIAAPQAYPNWVQFQPTECKNSRYPFRALIYTNWRIQTRQIQVLSSDIVAVEFKLENQAFLIFSVYILLATGTLVVDTDLLNTVLQAIERTKLQYPAHELLIAGDFNRHDQFWGGDSVQQDQGADILQFMGEYGLQLLLGRGTPTHESGSTIDLSLASAGLHQDLNRYKIWPIAYRPDHKAIEISFNLDIYDPKFEAKPLIRQTNWEKVLKEVLATAHTIDKGNLIEPRPEDIDQLAQQLTSIVSRAVQLYTPVSKPSPYGKRWWTFNLTHLRQAYTRARNDAKAVQRQGYRDHYLEQKVKEARKLFHDTARRQRRTHWHEFLDNTDNIWKTAKYLHPQEKSQFGAIPALHTEQGVANTEKEISTALLSQFFSQTAEVSQIEEGHKPNQLPWTELTKEEIHEALLRAKPFKAAGPDGLSTVVWQKLWPAVGDCVFQLFKASIQTGYLPQQWKIARIVPLRKPNKPDYSQPKAYRPISLLSTLGKLLEAVLAERLSYLDETYKLLPKAHFGARKQRSTIDALLYLTEQIHQAWKHKKTLSLVSFDVKGAYNGVNPLVLAQRLRQRRVPEIMVQWVLNFCLNRKASIMVNGKESEVQEITHAGLPQGSPLSPLLFLFYNANLVAKRVSNSSGLFAFVDNFNTWVVRATEEDNLRQIQTTILPRAEQ